MNQSTADVVEIMKLVRDQFNQNPDKFRLSRYRVNAVKEIALRTDRKRSTVANAYIREHAPEINVTDEFQKLINEWILNDSNELVDIIMQRIPAREREKTIDDLHDENTEVRGLLDLEVMDSIQQEKYPEGRKRVYTHLKKERNPKLVSDAKRDWIIKHNGNVKCTVCDFSFSKKYGRYGEHFIEAHHNIPISELSEETVIEISDLSPVCSNCHRIIHRKRPFLSINELREIVESQHDR